MQASTGQQKGVETATQEAMLGKGVCGLYQNKAGEQNVGWPAYHSNYCFGILTNSRDLMACEWELHCTGQEQVVQGYKNKQGYFFGLVGLAV